MKQFGKYGIQYTIFIATVGKYSHVMNLYEMNSCNVMYEFIAKSSKRLEAPVTPFSGLHKLMTSEN